MPFKVLGVLGKPPKEWLDLYDSQNLFIGVYITFAKSNVAITRFLGRSG